MASQQFEDGTVTVRHADPAIIVDPSVIAELQSINSSHVEADGTLVLDTAGEYRYQRVGERTVNGHTQLIYRRVHAAQPIAGIAATHDGPPAACSSPLCVRWPAEVRETSSPERRASGFSRGAPPPDTRLNLFLSPREVRPS